MATAFVSISIRINLIFIIWILYELLSYRFKTNVFQWRNNCRIYEIYIHFMGYLLPTMISILSHFSKDTL